MPLSTRLRRLRATLSIASTWAVGWGITAGVLGGVGMAIVDRLYSVPVPLAPMVQAFAIAGALAGAVSGIGFSAIVAAVGRRRSVDALSPLKLGLLSAVPACGIAAALFGFDPVFVSATALFAVGAGASTLSLARRGEAPALEALPTAPLPRAT